MSSNASLLVVDDEPDMGLIVKALGKRLGWEVEHRLDANSAWEFLCRSRPDLLLLDVRLPGMSGPDLCRRLRAEPGSADLRIALFTHAGVPEDVAAGLEAGAPYLVNKELICMAAAWRERLSEILAAPRGRGLVRPLGWTPDRPLSGSRDSLAATLSAGLRHPRLRALGSVIVKALLRRASQQAFGVAASRCEPVVQWLLAEGATNRLAVPHELDASSLFLLTECLAEQVWCLLGDSASMPIRVALTTLAPGLAEGPIRP